MPSVCRKFLLAGKGGLNITHSEPHAHFLSRYGVRAAQLQPLLEAFGPAALREWVHALGVPTFVGTSGRVFPAQMKAAPLLRAWLHRLRESGARFHMRHRWQGWDTAGALRFATPQGERAVRADSRGARARRRQLGTARVGWCLGAAAAGARRGCGGSAPRQLRVPGGLERALPHALRRAPGEVGHRKLRRIGTASRNARRASSW